MTRMKIGQRSLQLLQGDITREEVDAVVNAANSALLGGGGVDGAIHRAGGPSIMRECMRIGGCPTGSAVVTGAGRLKARHVIHAVGPIYRGGAEDAALLAGAYRASLELAKGLGLRSIAFPSIGTGAYGYPVENAAPIALGAAAGHLGSETSLELVRFVLFDVETLQAYADALGRLREEMQ